MYPPLGFKELVRTVWSLIRPNRVLIGFYFFCGRGTCPTPNVVQHMSHDLNSLPGLYTGLYRVQRPGFRV